MTKGSIVLVQEEDDESDGEFDLTQKITKDITLIAIYEKIESQSQENENKEQIILPICSCKISRITIP